MANRYSKTSRHTKETQIELETDLDGSGKADIQIGIPFLEHMLEQVSRHGMLDLKISGKGDLEVDLHHMAEDVGITFGQALADILTDKTGIRRYAHAYVPLDESLSRVVVDCSGRPGLHYYVDYPNQHIGNFEVDLIYEFFQGLVNHAMLTVHIDNIRGRNTHHIAETIFKAFGRALGEATMLDSRMKNKLPSTKEQL